MAQQRVRNRYATLMAYWACTVAMSNAFTSAADAQGASNPQLNIPALQKASACRAEIRESRAAVVADSSMVTPQTRLYLSSADGNGAGRLQSFSVMTTTGELRLNWEASERVPAAQHRRVISTNSDGVPTPLRWASIDAVRKSQLRDDELLLNYVRGDTAHEGTRFRARSDARGAHRLGGVGSVPISVGAPAYRHKDDLEAIPYARFANLHRKRRSMIYAGADDGMLHAFDASNGTEQFAFLPGSTFSRLEHIGSSAQASNVFGSPSTADVFFGGAWHSVLVGGLNWGGQAVYALDITDPELFAAAEANARRLILWEFTDRQDPDLGFTHSQPVVAKAINGAWVAVFGNGYGSRNADGKQSATGNAVLYIVDMRSGKLLRKIDTGVGLAQAPAGVTWENGLSTASVVDMDGDARMDHAYAGDLYGNLWKFDLTSADDAEWKVAFKGRPFLAASSPVQPITLRGEVARSADGTGAVVLVAAGTAPHMGLAFPSHDQVFHGLFDRTGEPLERRAGLHAAGTRIAPLSSAPGAALASMTASDASSGWQVDLKAASHSLGDQVFTSPILRNGRVFFIAGHRDRASCLSRSLNLVSIDVKNAAVETVPLWSSSEAEQAQTGIVLPASLAVAQHIDGSGSCKQWVFIPGARGNIQRHVMGCTGSAPGRQTWRQIR